MEKNHRKGPDKAGKRILRNEKQLVKIVWRWRDMNGFEIFQYGIDKGCSTHLGMKNKSKVVS